MTSSQPHELQGLMTSSQPHEPQGLMTSSQPHELQGLLRVYNCSRKKIAQIPAPIQLHLVPRTFLFQAVVLPLCAPSGYGRRLDAARALLVPCLLPRVFQLALTVVVRPQKALYLSVRPQEALYLSVRPQKALYLSVRPQRHCAGRDNGSDCST